MFCVSRCLRCCRPVDKSWQKIHAQLIHRQAGSLFTGLLTSSFVGAPPRRDGVVVASSWLFRRGRRGEGAAPTRIDVGSIGKGVFGVAQTGIGCLPPYGLMDLEIQ